MKIKLILLIVIAAVVATGVYALETYRNSSQATISKLPTSVTVKENLNSIPSFKTPKYLPKGYELFDSVVTSIEVELYYAHINSTKKNLQEGAIFFYVTFDNPAIQEGKKYFEDFKAKSQRGDVVEIFEINGMPAMGWESGVKDSITIFDNGTLVSTKPLDYPAAVAMIDTNDQVYYSARAFLPLAELKKIMSSLG